MKRVFLSIAVISGLCIFGCNPPSGDSTGGDTDGNNNTSTDIDAQIAAAESVSDKFNEVALSTSDRDAQNQQMLNFIRSLPIFVDSGIDGDCPWGQFADGRFMAVINNRPAEDDPDATSTKSVRNRNLPGSDTAQLFSIEGSAVVPPVGNVGKVVGTWLTDDGYAATSSIPMTFENLGAVNNDGIFYADCHGFEKTEADGQKLLFIVTDSQAKRDIQSKAEEGLTDPSAAISYANVAPLVEEGDIIIKSKPLLMFNYKYVQQKMSFAKDSLVFFNACHSFQDPRFYNACFNKGASVFMGWSQSVSNGAAIRAGLFFFDRMLGAQKVEPESPPQRPFDIDSVFVNMVDRKYAISFPKNGIVSTLQKARSPSDEPAGGFGLFAPTIRAIDVVGMSSADRTLRLRGMFGDTQGTVSIAGQDQAVRTWSSTDIQLDLNGAAPDLHGDIVVKVRNHESNKFPLTLWTGTITVKLTAYGSLQRTVTIDAHLLAGITATRSQPGGPPNSTTAAPQRGNLVANRATTATISAGGTYDNSASATSWLVNGANNLPTGYDGDRHFTISGQINLDTRVLTLEGGVGGFATDGLETQTATHTADGDLHSSLITDYATAFPKIVTIQLDQNFNIPAGFTAAQGPDLGQGPTNYTIQWTAMTAQSPPTDDTTR